MRFKTLGKNAVFLFTGQAYGALITLIFVPLLARYLGITGYGRYAYVYAFVGLFEMLSVFGMHQIFVREVARRRYDASIYLGNVLQLKVPFSLGIFVLICVASFFFVSPDLRLLVLICAFEVLLRKFFVINLSLSRAFERMEFEFLTTVVERTVVLASVLLAIHLDLGLPGIFLAFLFAAVVHALFGTFLVWSRLARPNFTKHSDFRRKLLLNSWPLGISREAEVLHSRIGTVLLGQLSSLQVVGAYSGGYRIYQMIILVVADAISQATLPALSRQNRHPHRFIHSFYRVFSLSMLVSTLVAASIWVIAPFGIRILLGPEFEASIPVLRGISVAIPFTFLSRLLSVTLQSADQQRIDSALTISTFLINLVLSLLLIPSLGAMGAIWALVVAEFISFSTKSIALAAWGVPELRQEAHSQL